MLRCEECGSTINLSDPEQGLVIECDHCGIDLEISEDRLISLQIGPSEE